MLPAEIQQGEILSLAKYIVNAFLILTAVWWGNGFADKESSFS